MTQTKHSPIGKQRPSAIPKARSNVLSPAMTRSRRVSMYVMPPQRTPQNKSTRASSDRSKSRDSASMKSSPSSNKKRASPVKRKGVAPKSKDVSPAKKRSAKLKASAHTNVSDPSPGITTIEKSAMSGSKGAKQSLQKKTTKITSPRKHPSRVITPKSTSAQKSKINGGKRISTRTPPSSGAKRNITNTRSDIISALTPKGTPLPSKQIARILADTPNIVIRKLKSPSIQYRTPVTPKSFPKSSVKSTPKSTVRSAVKSTIKSTSKSTPKSTVRSAVKSTSKSTPKSTVRSAVKLTIKSTSKSTPKSTLRSAVKSGIKSTPNSTTKSATKSSSKSTRNSSSKDIAKKSVSKKRSKVVSLQESTPLSTAHRSPMHWPRKATPGRPPIAVELSRSTPEVYSTPPVPRTSKRARVEVFSTPLLAKSTKKSLKKKPKSSDKRLEESLSGDSSMSDAQEIFNITKLDSSASESPITDSAAVVKHHSWFSCTIL